MAIDIFTTQLPIWAAVVNFSIALSLSPSRHAPGYHQSTSPDAKYDGDDCGLHAPQSPHCQRLLQDARLYHLCTGNQLHGRSQARPLHENSSPCHVLQTTCRRRYCMYLGTVATRLDVE